MPAVADNLRLDELFCELDELLPTCDTEHLRAHLYRLLRRLSALERAKTGLEDSEGAAYIVHRASDFMKVHMAVKMTVEDVARACDVSVTVLKRAFRDECGVGPATWWRTQRIEEAQRLLLETDLSVAQVGASVGYANPSKFAHAFQAHTGSVPSAWRASHQ